MNVDDAIYMCLLLSCIVVGYFYRRITGIQKKKWVGTLLGLLIVFMVSGYHIWHPLLTFFVNALIILVIPKNRCHLISFAFSFAYLLFFRITEHFGIPYPPTHTNLIQMMLTLKLVGLAFEINSSYQYKKKSDADKTAEEKLDDINPGLIDIFHYSFNYIGVLTGPYYRYKTFCDYFKLPYWKHANLKGDTFKKLKYVPMYCVLFLLGTHYWPISYAMTNDFYNNRSVLYRFWYVWPNFFNFRMRIYIGIVLSECICTMAGLGAYTKKMEPKAGHGPTKNFELTDEIIKNPTKYEYDFETIHNINPYGADFCTTFRDGMKNWNICIQYWLAMYVYKRFPNKKLRTTVTMLVSAFWHGMYLGHYVCIGLVPLYLPIEDIYVKLYLKDNKGRSLKVWEWIIWFFKMQAFSYLGMAFNLLVLKEVLRYYDSIYYCGFIGAAVLYITGLQLLKAKKKAQRKSGEKLELKEVNMTKLKMIDGKPISYMEKMEAE